MTKYNNHSINNEKIKTLLKSMRLPFILLTISCIFLAGSAAIFNRSSFMVYDLMLVAIGALAAHISVNSFNEYLDFKSGLDEVTKKTPFSGGSGALIENPTFAIYVFYSALISLTITILIGFYFIFDRGPEIFPIGLLGVIIIVSYTQWINRSPFLCLIAPGLAFGPLMIVGTGIVLTGEFSWSTLVISLIPFLLVNNLLLLNQLPDIKADITVGRRHFPIVYGIQNSLNLYLFNALLGALIIIIAVAVDLLPTLTLIGILPLLASIKVFKGLNAHREEISLQQFEHIEPLLGINVAITLVTPVLLGITLIIVRL